MPLRGGGFINSDLFKHLIQITPEEEKYIDGEDKIQKEIYTSNNQFEMERKLLLGEDRLITVRPHTRFIDFPEHIHNYIEIMYVCNGQITHEINGCELQLEKGDLLLLNQYVRHGVKKAGKMDIGINFIASEEFFDIPMKMLGNNNVLAEFLVNILRKKSEISQYLLFRTKGDQYIENIMENMIASMLSKSKGNDDVMNQYSMGLVFLYLLNHAENIRGNDAMGYEDVIIQSTLQYIDTWYKTASLTKIADDFNQPISFLSKLIKNRTGDTFQELLQKKRFQTAARLLKETDLTIEEISLDIGYENHSYFFRQFKKRYGVTPRTYRLENSNNK